MKRIYVCTRSLRENLELKNSVMPPVVVREDGGPEHYAHKVEIHGDSVTRFDLKGAHGDGQGPHIWVETDAAVTLYRGIDGPVTLL